MRLYRLGDAGEPVRDIQDRLGALEVDCSDDPAGEFGDATRAAVLAFQERRGIDRDGIVGRETWRLLVEAGFRLGDRLLYHRLPMLRGDDVAALQSRLNALGFDAGRVDGIFGPDTLRGLLDFQHNRHMGEDGISGPAVARELELIERATHKAGRHDVRERQWLRDRPTTVVGQRILLDPFARDEKEDVAAWAAAQGCERALVELGAHPILSRSADTTPAERVRAQRANRLAVDVVIAFAGPRWDRASVSYFGSELSHSEAGKALAGRIAGRLSLPALGRAIPILKETRAAAVLVAPPHLGTDAGREVAHAVDEFFSLDEDDPQ